MGWWSDASGGKWPGAGYVPHTRQTDYLCKVHLGCSARQVLLVRQHEDRLSNDHWVQQRLLQLLGRLGQASRVSGINNEDNAMDLGEVGRPHAPDCGAAAGSRHADGQPGSLTHFELPRQDHTKQRRGQIDVFVWERQTPQWEL